MHYKIFIHDNYPLVHMSLNDFESDFKKSNNIIQSGRNVIKKLGICGEQAVVKAFKKPDPIPGFLYKFFYTSKARRSFEYAGKLLDCGIHTADPIAYVEVYSAWRLKQSYFISDAIDYDFSIGDVLQNKTQNKQEILKQFTEFTHQFHQAGCLHLDYGPGNILVKKNQQAYRFSVVDINRMHFGNISAEQGIKNFNRLTHDIESIQMFCKRYGELSGLSSTRCQDLLNQAITENDNYWIRKKRLKKLKENFARSVHIFSIFAIMYIYSD